MSVITQSGLQTCIQDKILDLAASNLLDRDGLSAVFELVNAWFELWRSNYGKNVSVVMKVLPRIIAMIRAHDGHDDITRSSEVIGKMISIIHKDYMDEAFKTIIGESKNHRVLPWNHDDLLHPLLFEALSDHSEKFPGSVVILNVLWGMSKGPACLEKAADDLLDCLTLRRPQFFVEVLAMFADCDCGMMRYMSVETLLHYMEREGFHPPGPLTAADVMDVALKVLVDGSPDPRPYINRTTQMAALHLVFEIVDVRSDQEYERVLSALQALRTPGLQTKGLIDVLQRKRFDATSTFEETLQRLGIITSRPSDTAEGEAVAEVHGERLLRRDETECVICLDRAPTARLMPCGHLVYCGECDAKVKKHCRSTRAYERCPLCRGLCSRT